MRLFAAVQKMLAALLIMGLISLAVVIHYEALFQFSHFMPRLQAQHRLSIVAGVFAALAAHVVEICVFGVAYFYLDKAEGWGHLAGEYDGSLLDAIYYSFATFTTLGFGDITPEGELRYLTGLEALTGFVLITWTASFLYLQMTRYWDGE